MEWMCKVDQSVFCADEHFKTSKAGCTGRAMDRWYLEVHTCGLQRLMTVAAGWQVRRGANGQING